MTDREQIEEMAKKLRAYCYDLVLTDKDDCERLADFIVGTLGYRKQVDGEWKKVHDKAPRYVCTSCNHLCNNKEYKYCPHCGAKMSGGAK